MQSSWSGTQYSLPPQPGEPALGIKGWITDAAAKDLAKRGGRDRVLLWASGVRSHATPPTSMAMIARRSGERPRYPTPPAPGNTVRR